MSNNAISTDILIIGGGAIGLFLGCRLAWLGMDFQVVEATGVRPANSRSIGIHPPSLELMNRIDLVDHFLDEGLKISDGMALGEHGILGRISFRSCPGPYRFVLTLPQYRTETILESHLCKKNPGVLHKNCRAVAFQNEKDHIMVTCRNQYGEQYRFKSKLVVGCDGKRSIVRQWMNTPFNGSSYPDTYLMCDFEDTTDFGLTAAVYLQKAGLIESFPLPGNTRRWVVKTPTYIESPSEEAMARVLEKRTGFLIPVKTGSGAGSFGVQHFVARDFGIGRFVIIGDAAHIVSPFGGQGMNLGWMDAWHLAELLSQRPVDSLSWKYFDMRRRWAAWQALKRAELNMWMGRSHRFQRIHDHFVRTLLKLPTRHILPRLYTMRWL